MSTIKPKISTQIWRFLKPILTLGLSLLVGSIARRDPSNSDVIKVVGSAVSSEVVDEIDTILDNHSEISTNKSLPAKQ